MSPRSASSNERREPGMSASSSPSAAKKAAMSLSDMGANELPKGSDWWRRCLDPPVPVLEPSDWFRDESLRELSVSWRCIVADWVFTGRGWYNRVLVAFLIAFDCCWVTALKWLAAAA